MINNWIFLRGLTRGNIHWGDFPLLFLEANPNAEVEFLEIPGNGLLSNEQSPIDPEVIIEILKKKSKFTKTNSRYHLCGISLGGMVALKWAELYPAKVESVTVINSSLSQNSVFYQRLMAHNYLSLLGALFESDSFKQEKIILKITSNKFAKNEKYLKLFGSFALEHKVSRSNFVRQLVLAKNIHIHNFPKLKLAVISSLNDRLVHSSCSEKISIDLKGHLTTHPTAGHDLPLDEPEWLIDQLLKAHLKI